MAKTLCPLLMQVSHAKVAIFFTWQICLLTLLAKIKLSRKFLNIQYPWIPDVAIVVNSLTVSPQRSERTSAETTVGVGVGGVA